MAGKIQKLQEEINLMKEEVHVVQTTKPSWAIGTDAKLVELEDHSRRITCSCASCVSRVLRSLLPRALRALVFYMPHSLRALVPYLFHGLTCFVHYVLSCLTCLTYSCTSPTMSLAFFGIACAWSLTYICASCPKCSRASCAS